jgi:hypothetical protein
MSHNNTQIPNLTQKAKIIIKMIKQYTKIKVR